MARIRSIRPEFFTDADITELSPLHRLLFAGLWCHADKAGRLEDKPRELKVRILPYDDCNVDAMLDDLAARGFIIRYDAGTLPAPCEQGADPMQAPGQREGSLLIEIPKFTKHQHCHKDEKPSTRPGPTAANHKHAKSLAENDFAARAPLEQGAGTVRAPLEHPAKAPISCLLASASGLLASSSKAYAGEQPASAEAEVEEVRKHLQRTDTEAEAIASTSGADPQQDLLEAIVTKLEPKPKPKKPRKESEQQRLYRLMEEQRQEVTGGTIPERFPISKINGAGKALLDFNPDVLGQAHALYLADPYGEKLDPPWPTGFFVSRVAEWVSKAVRVAS